MAGLARLILQEGLRVSGNEIKLNAWTDQLEGMGAAVFPGHEAEHLPHDISLVIRTPAVPDESPDLVEARRRGIRVLSRGEALAEWTNRRKGIAVAGAHGKTTTSAMLALVLRRCGVNTGYFVGGDTQLPGAISDGGESEWAVIEADESDATLVHYRPQIGVITNIDWDHIETFASEQDVLDCFDHFAAQCSKGFLVADKGPCSHLAERFPHFQRVYPEGELPWTLLGHMDDGLGGMSFQFRDGNAVLHKATLQVAGRHNAMNALLALAVANEVGVSVPEAVVALSEFHSVGRRFERLRAQRINLIADYAHHPVEICCFLEAARKLVSGNMNVVFQPHRYSRTRHLMKEFVEVLAPLDLVILLPVYAASEAPIDGGTSSDLARELRAASKGEVFEVPTAAEAWQLARTLCAPNDFLLVIGAGDVYEVMELAPDEERPDE